MTDTNGGGARAHGQAIRQARLARVRRIRRRIITGSVALFLAAWLLITVVLVSGHDPALAKHSSATTAASSSTPATSTTTGSGSGTGATSTSSSQSSGSSSSGGTISSVTTQQS